MFKTLLGLNQEFLSIVLLSVLIISIIQCELFFNLNRYHFLFDPLVTNLFIPSTKIPRKKIITKQKENFSRIIFFLIDFIAS